MHHIRFFQKIPKEFLCIKTNISYCGIDHPQPLPDSGIAFVGNEHGVKRMGKGFLAGGIRK